MYILVVHRVFVEESLSNRDTEHAEAKDPRLRVCDLGTVRLGPIPSADLFY
jgi:hypothetical protein